MNNYFYNMVDPDEMATLEYIPTIPKFLEFIKKQYSDYPAISDKVKLHADSCKCLIVKCIRKHNKYMSGRRNCKEKLHCIKIVLCKYS